MAQVAQLYVNKEEIWTADRQAITLKNNEEMDQWRFHAGQTSSLFPLGGPGTLSNPAIQEWSVNFSYNDSTQTPAAPRKMLGLGIYIVSEVAVQSVEVKLTPSGSSTPTLIDSLPGPDSIDYDRNNGNSPSGDEGSYIPFTFPFRIAVGDRVNFTISRNIFDTWNITTASRKAAWPILHTVDEANVELRGF